MKTKPYIFLLVLYLGYSFLSAQSGVFIENKGQWEGDYHYKLSKGYGGVFLRGDRLVFNLHEPITTESKSKSSPDHGHHHGIPKGTIIDFHAYEMRFLNANEKTHAYGNKRKKEYHNYLLGNDTSRWKSKVGLFEEVIYKDLYPGTDIRYYFTQEGNLKYDLIIKPGASPDDILIRYEGQDGLKLVYGNLIVHTSVEDILETVPYAYQVIEGEKKEVECEYQLDGDIVSFQTGSYDPERELIIDPELIFSTYSGSRSDNWGYTATYGVGGEAYGGGIILSGGNNNNEGNGYPTTSGAYKVTFSGGELDIGITKFTADGTDAIYSTYIGGSRNEMPYSLIEGKNKELIILGNTSSSDFPVPTTAYQDTFSGGSNAALDSNSFDYTPGVDIFIAKLDSTGGQLLASTYLGGTGADGINLNLEYNYGDQFRGDVAVDNEGNIYGVSNTFSDDFPTKGNIPFSDRLGKQDGVIFSLDSSLSTLNWSTYFGGKEDDGVFSLNLVSDRLYVTGGLRSSGISFPGISSYQQDLSGGTDGFIAAFNTSDGSVEAFTYNGTPQRDVNFFVDYDRDLNICVFGQTYGNYLVQGEDVFVNPNSSQFLQKLDPDLQQSIKSTVFGNGIQNKANISPIALMVDTCGNVYISGWGGGNNEIITKYSQGNVLNMPVTANAFRANTDEADFYLMVLDASWKSLSYATYFGEVNGTGDHVDGGTSRFRKDGTIFQAACAGCGGSNRFPTTDSAFSRVNNSIRCNMAVFKFSLEQNITTVDVKSSRDTGCIPYQTNLLSNTNNADILLIQYPDGSRDTIVDELIIDHIGLRTFGFIGIDTICGFRDSTELSFYGYTDSLSAGFSIDYDTCTSGLEAKFNNLSRDGDIYFWDFGDSTTSNDMNPTHVYKEEGTYTIMMAARNLRCGKSDTIVQELRVTDRSGNGRFQMFYKPCEEVKANFVTGGKHFNSLSWYVNDVEMAEGREFSFEPEVSGLYTIRLESEDTICGRNFSREETLNMFVDDFELNMPNVFTPNGDGDNDLFGNMSKLHSHFLTSYSFKVYNRWGKELFSGAEASAKWNGLYDGDEVPQGVYYYIINYEDICGKSEELKGFVHLFR